MNTQRLVEGTLSVLSGFLLVYLFNCLIFKNTNIWLKIIILIIKASAASALAFLLIAYASPFLWKYGDLLAGLYVALLGDCLCDLIMIFVSVFSKGGSMKLRLAISIIATLSIFLYGTINSQIIRQKELSYTSSKLKNRHRFVFFSDLHYGSAQGQKTVEEALVRINALKPEFVLLGGDITDEHTTKQQMEWLFNQIGALDAPVYYIYGNHDRQIRGDYLGGRKYTEQELVDAIVNNDITILKDNHVILDDVAILGREDESNEGRLPLDKLSKVPSEEYLICVDHSPYHNDEIAAMKADLQLSGHTHAGQFIPLRLVYTLAKLNVVGEYKINDTILYVSPGITGWYYPFRNESVCEYELIDLIPE